MNTLTQSTLFKEKEASPENLVKDYLQNGGTVTKCKPFNNGGTQQIRLKEKIDRHSKEYQARSRR